MKNPRLIESMTSRKFLVFAFLLFGFGSAATSDSPQKAGHAAPSILVKAVESNEVPLPAEFQMAMYENLVAEIAKSKKFEHVYRDGDQQAAADPNLLTLEVSLQGFKKGSAEARQVTSVAGATSIRALVHLSDGKGQSLLNKNVNGRVLFFGENLRATYNFAKAVAKQVGQGTY